MNTLSDEAKPENEAPPAVPKRRLPWGWMTFGGILLFLAALVVWDWSQRPPEPVYRDRPLSAWMTDAVSPEISARTNAETAILAVGTNAMPRLLDYLQLRDPLFARYAEDSIRFLPRRVWELVMQVVKPASAAQRRREAANALALLGPAATPALPILQRALSDASERVVERAVEALVRLGPTGAPALATGLSHTNEIVVMYAIGALTRLGPDAAAAAPALAEAVLRLRQPYQDFAANSLARIGSASVPALADLLKQPDPDGEVRDHVRRCLIGVAAASSDGLHAVVALTTNQTVSTRVLAVETLSAPVTWTRVVMRGLQAACADRDPAVRLAAVQSLHAASAWTPHVTSALPAIQVLRSDPVSEVRAAADKAHEGVAAHVQAGSTAPARPPVPGSN